MKDNLEGRVAKPGFFRRAVIAAGLLGALVSPLALLPGCSGSKSGPAPTPTPTATPSPSPSPTPVNHSPNVSYVSGDRTDSEGHTYVVKYNATDSDGDNVTLSTSGLPSWASATFAGNGTKTPSATIGGLPPYSIASLANPIVNFPFVVTATDGKALTPLSQTLSVADAVPVEVIARKSEEGLVVVPITRESRIDNFDIYAQQSRAIWIADNSREIAFTARGPPTTTKKGMINNDGSINPINSLTATSDYELAVSDDGNYLIGGNRSTNPTSQLLMRNEGSDRIQFTEAGANPCFRRNPSNGKLEALFESLGEVAGDNKIVRREVVDGGVGALTLGTQDDSFIALAGNNRYPTPDIAGRVYIVNMQPNGDNIVYCRNNDGAYTEIFRKNGVAIGGLNVTPDGRGLLYSIAGEISTMDIRDETGALRTDRESTERILLGGDSKVYGSPNSHLNSSAVIPKPTGAYAPILLKGRLFVKEAPKPEVF